MKTQFRKAFLGTTALLLILTLIFFWRLITPVKHNVASLDPLVGGDLNSYYYPMFAFYAEALAKGKIPLWNPYSFCGFPQVADLQAGTFYPLNILLPLFVRQGRLPYFAVELMIILHCFLAALFMYLLAKYLTENIWAGIFAGIVFAFNGFMATYYASPSVVYTAVWIPMILLLALVTIKRLSRLYACITGLFMGISFLAGYLELFVYMFYLICALFIYFSIANRKLKILILLAIVILVTIGISAIQLLPSLELQSQVIGANLGFSNPAANIPYSYLAPSTLVTAIIPMHPGWNSNIYCGILTLVLVFLIFLDKTRRNDSTVKFFVGLAIASILLSFGKPKFLYELLYIFLPGIDFGRTPVMFIFIYACSISLLSAWGVSFLAGLLNREAKHYLYSAYRKLVYLFFISLGFFVFVYIIFYLSKGNDVKNLADKLGFSVIMLGLSILVILFRIKGITKRDRVGWLAFSLLAILVTDLFSLRQINKFYIDSPPEFHYQLNPLVRFFKNDKDIYRISAHNFSPLFPEGTGNVHRLFLDSGYVLRLSLKDYLQFAGLSTNLGGNAELSSIAKKRLTDMLNVKYIISVKKPDWGDVLQEVSIAGLSPDIKVFENPDYFPRAWTVNDWETIPDEAKGFKKLGSPEFDPKRNILLQEPFAKFSSLASSGSDSRENLVEIKDYSINSISLLAYFNKNGFLVLSEVFYPGWNAYVDGKKEKIYKADYLFRAIPVPLGEHKIKIVYSPVSFKFGLGITLATIIGIVALHLRLKREEVSR